MVFPELNDQSHIRIFIKSPPPKRNWLDIVEFVSQFEWIEVIYQLNPDDEYDLSILNEFKK